MSDEQRQALAGRRLQIQLLYSQQGVLVK
jgi:hypothetical protein